MKDLMIEARVAFGEGKLEEALGMLEGASMEDNPEACFLMGEIYYNQQNWGAALNQFRACLVLDEDNKPAQTYVDMILNILSFFHTDQFNP
jgi:predicted negative regulator of RcsB-dependent stress response